MKTYPILVSMIEHDGGGGFNKGFSLSRSGLILLFDIKCLKSIIVLRELHFLPFKYIPYFFIVSKNLPGCWLCSV